MEKSVFSEVTGKNMTKVGKVFAGLRDYPGIPYLDGYEQRRILHSICNSVCSSTMAGWKRNILHLQQNVGHEKNQRAVKPLVLLKIMLFLV